MVVGAEAPTPRFAISIDGDGVIGPDGGKGSPDNVWHIGRLHEDARDVFRIFDDAAVWKGGRVEAGLRAIATPPDEAAAGGSCGDGMVSTAGDVRDSVFVGEI